MPRKPSLPPPGSVVVVSGGKYKGSKAEVISYTDKKVYICVLDGKHRNTEACIMQTSISGSVAASASGYDSNDDDSISTNPPSLNTSIVSGTARSSSVDSSNTDACFVVEGGIYQGHFVRILRFTSHKAEVEFLDHDIKGETAMIMKTSLPPETLRSSAGVVGHDRSSCSSSSSSSSTSPSRTTSTYSYGSGDETPIRSRPLTRAQSLQAAMGARRTLSYDDSDTDAEINRRRFDNTAAEVHSILEEVWTDVPGIIKTKDFAVADAHTRKLLDRGVKLPRHVPLVCVSFASRDLASNHRNHDGNDGKAGNDPWGVCDYIRDALYWPSDAMYIDKEQVGSYYCSPDASERPVYHDPPKGCKQRIRPWVKPSPPEGWTVEPLEDDTLRDGPLPKARNYHTVFRWAQFHAKIQLVFISAEYFKTENCTVELEAIRDGRLSDRCKAVLFVLLDNEKDYKRTPLLSSTLKRLRQKQGLTCQIFNISHYHDWWLEGRKTPLSEAANELIELKTQIETLARQNGYCGDAEHFFNESQLYSMLRNHDVIRRPDIVGDRVRNRFLPEVQRRVCINEASEHDLKTRLPRIGEERARRIVQYRKSSKLDPPIRDLVTLKAAMGSCGRDEPNKVLPFISFVSTGGAQYF